MQSRHSKPVLSRTALVVAASLSMCSIAAAQPQFRLAAERVQGQYIVVLKPEVAALANESSSSSNGRSVAAVAQEMRGQHGVKVQKTFSHALRGFVVQADDKALARMMADDRIEYIEEDGYVSASATQSGATWGIDRVDQRDLPLNSTYVYDTTASNVHAYIIDTGVLGSHSQFTGRMGGGYTAISDGGGTTDCNGHGTHVAGTVGGTTYALPGLFMVMATQNPIEQEGTYPLPEAQLDRFIMHLRIGYPDPASERAILKIVRGEALGESRASKAIATEEMILSARQEALKVHVSEPLESYMLQLIFATRSAEGPGAALAGKIAYGASPRGTIALDRCARVHAWMRGADFATPLDVQAVAHDVLRHRLILTFEAEADGVTKDSLIDELIALVPVS